MLRVLAVMEERRFRPVTSAAMRPEGGAVTEKTFPVPRCPHCGAPMRLMRVATGAGSKFEGLTFWHCTKAGCQPRGEEERGTPAPKCAAHPGMAMKVRLGENPGWEGVECWWCRTCRDSELSPGLGEEPLVYWGSALPVKLSQLPADDPRRRFLTAGD